MPPPREADDSAIPAGHIRELRDDCGSMGMHSPGDGYPISYFVGTITNGVDLLVRDAADTIDVATRNRTSKTFVERRIVVFGIRCSDCVRYSPRGEKADLPNETRLCQHLFD